MAIIDKLRGVDILSPQLGEEPAREAVEWLQDELRPLAGDDKLDLMMAQIDARFAQINARFCERGSANLARCVRGHGDSAYGPRHCGWFDRRAQLEGRDYTTQTE